MNTIKINAQKKVPVTPGMIGLFFEDINYNLDGGLHAEMIENRNFESLKAWGDWDDYHTAFDGMYGWSQWSVDGSCALTIGTDAPQNEVNPHYLHVEAKCAASGFANKAYDGIYVQEGMKYQVWKSSKKGSGYKKMTSTSKLYYKNTSGLTKGKTYYYKVRGYKSIGGKYYYTNWSNVVSQKVTK